MVSGDPVLDPFAGIEDILEAELAPPDGCVGWLFTPPDFHGLTRYGNMFTQEWLICMLGETIMKDKDSYNPLGWQEPSILYDNLPAEDRLHFDAIWEQLQNEYTRLWADPVFASINNSEEGFYRYDYKLIGTNAILYFYILGDYTRGGLF